MVRSRNKYVLAFLYYLALLLPSGLAAQEVSGGIFEAYETYFEQGRETIFLDLPKEAFYPNEPIPFAGYVLEAKTHRPSAATTNVYTVIYDSLGVPIEQGLYYAKAGTFRGQLKLPDSLPPGTYYIKAYTNWMKNFDPQLMQVRSFRRIDSTSLGLASKMVLDPKLQFFPEGGSLVAGVENTVGFHYEPGSEASSTVLSCRLLDQWGAPVLEGININAHGYGKFLLKPEADAQYMLEVEPETGTIFRAKLPEPNDKGVAISINAIPEDDIVVQVNTRALDLKGVVLALHRDGNLKVLEFDMTANQQRFRIPKEQALSGLNKLSVFDTRQNLLAERIFYNDMDPQAGEPSMEIGQARQVGDSIDLPISLKEVPSGNIAQLSLAVLPIETKAHGSLSIKKWFGLQSYFDRSTDQFPNETKNERGALYDLDLFLLGNRWNRYDWRTILEGPPKTDYVFQSGISLQGFIRGDSKAKGKNLIAYQKSVGQYYTSTVGNNLEFEFADLYLVGQEPIQFFLEGSELHPKASILLNYEPEFKPDYLSYIRRQPKLQSSWIQQVVRDSDNRPSFPAATVLDEVVLSVRKVPELSRNESLSGGVYDGVKMTPEEASKSIRLSNYLRKLGFQVRLIPQLAKVGVFAKSAQDDPPIVYVDGFRTGNYIDDLLLSNVDEIYYEHYGLEGSDGGSLYIYQNYGQQQDKEHFLQKIAEVGFSSKQFERDFRLTSFAQKTFLEYGLAHWEDQLILKAGQQKQLRFPAYGLKDFKIFINGITDDGGLLSDEFDVLVED